MFFVSFCHALLLMAVFSPATLRAAPKATSQRYWIKVHATNKFERTEIAKAGVSIEAVKDDYVVVIGSETQKRKLEKSGKVMTSFVLPVSTPMDFPADEAGFHNYERLQAALLQISTKYPQFTSLNSIGKSLEGREIYSLRLSGDLKSADARPGAVFMGGHHAREHLSVEVPLKLATYLADGYAANDPVVRRLIDGRDVHIIPLVNPDGAEEDIKSGAFQYWRKNLSRNRDGSLGVDLNRNYGYGWGGEGASQDPDSETYMGPQAFSEPETRAVRDFLDKQTNITMLLSFHTFSNLILYPWGNVYDPVADPRDKLVFETMGAEMARWNGYKSEQASALYVASGDTVDWAYAAHKIIGYTFELDPADYSGGGFYPKAEILPGVFKKNLQPCLYMLEHADNPYRTIEPKAFDYGLRSPLLD